MKNISSEEGIRERLIIAGIKEIEKHGMGDFSLRRVASMCEVSCAAPYRHYKNKDELVLSIISYINSRWYMMWEQIEKAYGENKTEQLVESYVGIVRFLIGNPNYIPVMLPLQNGMNEAQQKEREKLWCGIDRLHHILSKEKKLSAEQVREQEFLLKTLVYGTVMLLDGADAGNTEGNVMLMREELNRILAHK